MQIHYDVVQIHFLIISMAEGGLAQRTKAIQLGDELVEVNGACVRGKTLKEAIPLLQNAGDLVKLKLTRMVIIPERDFQRAPSFRLPPRPPPSPIYAPLQPAPTAILQPLTSPQHQPPTSSKPIYAPLSPITPPSFSPLFSHGPRSPRSGSEDLPTITLLPQTGPRGGEGGLPQEVTKVTLFKDTVYEDFGFSVSDGLYERGIFVNTVRKGGPADTSGLLKAFDRILQINSTRTAEFDCCLAVPLIAAAGDKIELLLTRSFPPIEASFTNSQTVSGDEDSRDSVGGDSNSVPWIDETDHDSSIS